MSISNEPAPILRVTAGTPVYTQDDQKLGTVKEVRPTHFRIATGLLQRDYWLPADLVIEAVPDETVVLAVDRADLDTYKAFEEPASAA